MESQVKTVELADDILITGVSGFVGSNLVKYLENDRDIRIYGVSRYKEKIKYLSDTIQSIYSYEDLYDSKKKFNVYIHLSGKVHDESNETDEIEYFKANYLTTKKIFNRFLNDPNAKKFIFLSTIHVLTEIPECELTESYEPQPFTPYGRSKYKAEQYIQKKCPADKDYYIIRPSMIHGPGNKGNLNLLYKLVKRGIPYPVGAFNNKRSFVSIGNLCFVLKEIIKRDIERGLYHLADDDPTYTHDLVQLIAEVTHNQGKILNVSPRFLKLAAKIGNFLPLPISKHKLNKLTYDFVVSNEKLMNALNKELPVKSRDGIIKTIKSFE